MTTVATYRTRQSTVRAIRFTGENLDACRAFLGGALCEATTDRILMSVVAGLALAVVRWEWVVRDDRGRFWRYDAAEFERTFEPHDGGGAT